MKRANKDSISLNKFISNTGMCSRREADRLIEQGRVSINKKTAQMGNRVKEGDIVIVDGRVLKTKTRTTYIAFNKPVGIVCTTDIKEKNNIISYLNFSKRVFPIGRLDKQSEGLIFLTNDGDIVNKILRAGNNHEKEYLVTVKYPITPNFISRMSKGVPILDTVTKPCEVEQVNKYSFRIILTQGLNRQIRRMCEFLNNSVVKLKRVRIMNVTIEKLPTGHYRALTGKEIKEINQLISGSSKTEEASKDDRKKKANRKPNNTPTQSKKSTFKKQTSKKKEEVSTKDPRIGKSKRSSFNANRKKKSKLAKMKLAKSKKTVIKRKR